MPHEFTLIAIAEWTVTTPVRCNFVIELGMKLCRPILFTQPYFCSGVLTLSAESQHEQQLDAVTLKLSFRGDTNTLLDTKLVMKIVSKALGAEQTRSLHVLD